jgi:GST-like protein
MLKLYYNSPKPNPPKVALFLEEAGLPYKIVPIDLYRGEQHQPDFLELNPNAKVPVLVDGAAVIFDSTAILIHLVGKTGLFGGGGDPVLEGELLSWLLLIGSGLSPFSGQAMHFRYQAPDPKEYPLTRYMFEAERHWTLIETRLSTRQHMLGDHYSAVDMSLWGWAPVLPMIFGDDAWVKFPNIKRWLDELDARPAAKRVRAMEAGLTFKTELDEEALANQIGHWRQTRKLMA